MSKAYSFILDLSW